jgi:hypothetical protein
VVVPLSALVAVDPGGQLVRVAEELAGSPAKARSSSSKEGASERRKLAVPSTTPRARSGTVIGHGRLTGSFGETDKALRDT